MIAIPAIDLRDGACVQLVGGSFDAERVRIDDPVSVAQRWRDAGFRRLHVVDLDAAVRGGSNAETVSSIIEADDDVEIQVGGGVRTSQAVADLLEAGASRVVVGTRALEDAEWLSGECDRWPDRIIVAADVRDGKPSVDGWQRSLRTDLEVLLHDLNALPLAGVLVTSVNVEGKMRGPDLALMERVRNASSHAIIASGGVSSLEDLRELQVLGVAGCVIGMALYTGAIDAAAAAEEFCE